MRKIMRHTNYTYIVSSDCDRRAITDNRQHDFIHFHRINTYKSCEQQRNREEKKLFIFISFQQQPHCQCWVFLVDLSCKSAIPLSAEVRVKSHKFFSAFSFVASCKKKEVREVYVTIAWHSIVRCVNVCSFWLGHDCVHDYRFAFMIRNHAVKYFSYFLEKVSTSDVRLFISMWKRE